jgi:hypothetical protein
MPSVFAGVDELIDKSLGMTSIGRTPQYFHKTSASRLAAKPPAFDGASLIRQIDDQIERNWLQARVNGQIRPASSQNWRWKKQLYISEHNESREKKTEKKIADECDDNWVNQVPTSSGLLNSTSDRACSIDLVHRVSASEFEFVELKIDSDTPLFAAFEILKYGMMFVFSRRHSTELGYNPAGELLNAKTITLCVLAPSQYYAGQNLDWLEAELSRGLRELKSADFCMDFHFEYFLQRSGTGTKLIESRRRIYHQFS